MSIDADESAFDGFFEHELCVSISDYEKRFGPAALMAFLNNESRQRGFEIRRMKRRRGSSRRTHGRMEARP